MDGGSWLTAVGNLLLVWGIFAGATLIVDNYKEFKVTGSIPWTPVLHIPTTIRNGGSLHTALWHCNCSSSTIALFALQLLIFHNCTICSAIAPLPQMYYLLCSPFIITLFALQLLIFHDCTILPAIAHLPQLQYLLKCFAIKLYLCDIHNIHLFLALQLFILHNGTTCLCILFLCTEITLQNLHLSCCSTHMRHLLQGATC